MQPQRQRALQGVLAGGAIVLILAALLGLGAAARGQAAEVIVIHHAALATLLAQDRSVAVVLYVLAYAVATGAGFPGAILFTALGGYLFGWERAIPAALSGALLGAAITFFLARGLLRAPLRRRLGARLQRVEKEFATGMIAYLMFLRFMVLVPFAVVNAICGVLQVRAPMFFATTLIGILPATVAASLAGAGLGAILSREAALLAACQAAERARCVVSPEVLGVLAPEFLAVLSALAVLALTPVALRRFLKRQTAPARPPVPPGRKGAGLAFNIQDEA